MLAGWGIIKKCKGKWFSPYNYKTIQENLLTKFQANLLNGSISRKSPINLQKCIS